MKAESWELPPVFRWIAGRFKVQCSEMASTFNCGVGIVLVVGKDNAKEAIRLLKEVDEEPVVIGELVARGSRDAPVHIEGSESAWLMLPELGVSLPFPQVLSSLQDVRNISRSKCVVFTGGIAQASPVPALLEAAEVHSFPAEVTAVVSTSSSCRVLQMAKHRSLRTHVVGADKDNGHAFTPPPRPGFAPAALAQYFSEEADKVLEDARSDLVIALDDFDLSLLTTAFRQKWAGKLITVRASLGPVNLGANPVLDALEQGLLITGCTVYQQTHDSAPPGLVVMQETTKVVEEDTVTSLHQRICEEAEAKALVEAVRLIASGKWKNRRPFRERLAGPDVDVTATSPSSPSKGKLEGDAKRYEQRGVSADKGDVHAAIQNMDKGLFPKAFCKVVPDYISGDPSMALVMHADGAGTKSSLAYMYWKKTGDLSVWKGIAQDALVMNLDDLLCVGITDKILLSSTIGRNKIVIPKEVVAAVIQGTNQLVEELNKHGVSVMLTGGETADVGDLVRTIIVDSTVAAQIPRADVIDNGNIRPGDVIVGLASFGRATYETEYNSGIGSNGLTSARHDTFEKKLAQEFPESFDPNVPQDLVYSGRIGLEDLIEVDGPGSEIPAGKLLLSPTRTYAPVIKKILASGLREQIHGMVHCSGGAQTKVLHFVDGVHVVKDNLLRTPPVFTLIQRNSGTAWEEMYKVFNMGHRMEIYTNEATAAKVVEISKSFGIQAQVIGRVEAAPGTKKLTIISEHGHFEY